jgi:hypothetical protein
VSAEGVTEARAFFAERFPLLRDSPLTEFRVCQYENTSNGDFLIDRHPELANVWLAGGGSGHGFKHGLAVAAYLSGRILDGADRFAQLLASSTEKNYYRLASEVSGDAPREFRRGLNRHTVDFAKYIASSDVSSFRGASGSHLCHSGRVVSGIFRPSSVWRCNSEANNAVTWEVISGSPDYHRPGQKDAKRNVDMRSHKVDSYISRSLHFLRFAAGRLGDNCRRRTCKRHRKHVLSARTFRKN